MLQEIEKLFNKINEENFEELFPPDEKRTNNFINMYQNILKEKGKNKMPKVIDRFREDSIEKVFKRLIPTSPKAVEAITYLYSHSEDIKNGINWGLYFGIREGYTQVRLLTMPVIAEKLYKHNIPNDIILDVTEISESKLQEIITSVEEEKADTE